MAHPGSGGPWQWLILGVAVAEESAGGGGVT